jgi:RHS repeat-associated protein
VDGSPDRGWLYRDDLSVAAELNGNGTLRHRYLYGTLGHSPDLLMHGDTAYRVITDHLGSVRAVVRTTDGVLVQRLDHDEWGVPTLDQGGSFQSLGYAGGLMDRETELVRFGARDYEPRAGRWTAKDPVGFRGWSTNLYRYVWDDPVGSTDPYGLGYFAKRPLDKDGLRILPVKHPLTKTMDHCNCELVHEQYFQDDGVNWGYFGVDGGGPMESKSEIRADKKENVPKYSREPGYYDDETMRRARANIEAVWVARNINIRNNNCQDYTDALRREYALLMDGPFGNH